MKRLDCALVLALFACGCSGPTGTLSPGPETWRPVTVSFTGPETSESADPNPFSDYRLTVSFAHAESHESITVPGYYAADGDAAETSADAGDVWQARFTPTHTGEWSYTASFRTGAGVALSADPEAGAATAFDGATGTFTVVAAAAPDARDRGILQHPEGHYLRYSASGEYFLKGGADSPENFLGYVDFDQTSDTAAHEGIDTDTGTFLHAYEPHARDAKPDDPTWQGGKGKNILGALNYLASKGMNSVYFLTYNVDGGDGKDTWMWTGPDVRDRFDVSKLAQWDRVFGHMSRLGLMLHVITAETENDEELGGGPDLNDIRKLYLRELVARFGYHPAIMWNLGEENDMPDADRKQIAAYLRALDAYDHPITVHTHNRQALTFYDGLLGDLNFDATSIQGELAAANAETIALRRRSAEAGRPWAIFHDEQTPASTGVKPDADDPDHDGPRQGHLWGNLMGGGSGVEWYFGYQFAHMDLNAEDWRSRETMWDQTRYALEFFQDHLPFHEMEPANELASAEGAYVFAKAGEAYAVYLPKGGTTNIEAPDGEYTVRWYDPRRGGELQEGSVATLNGAGTVGNPPHDAKRDWVVLIRSR